MIEFFKTLPGIITGLIGFVTACGTAIGMLTKWLRAKAEITRLGRELEVQADREKREHEMELIRRQHEKDIEEERKQHAKALLDRVIEDLEVERAYSKQLLDQKAASDQHAVDCNKRLLVLEHGRVEDAKAMERMHGQIEYLIKVAPNVNARAQGGGQGVSLAPA